jgi:SAM-dependent methyltransferase
MSDAGRKQILSHLSESTQKDISKLFNRVDADKEFEFIFFSKKGAHMNKEKYVLLLKYLRSMGKTKKMVLTQPERTLDISYNASGVSSTKKTTKMINNDIIGGKQGKEKENDNTTLSDSSTDVHLNNQSEPSLPEQKRNVVYRVSINGTETINNMLNRMHDIQNKNYVIYKFLLHTLRREKNLSESLRFMSKTREVGDTIDVDDLNMRVRLSTETDLTDAIQNKKTKYADIVDSNLNKLLSETTVDLESRSILNDNITFRLKERTSLYIEKSDGHIIRIDLTDTKTTKDLRRLNTTSSNYELELEYGATNAKSVNKEHLNVMYNMTENLLKLIQQSLFIIGSNQSNKVIKYYKDMTGVDATVTNLVGRQAVSLEIQHTTELLPNRYAVTDKADGERCFLIIYENGVYIINTNLVVKDTGIILDKKTEHYNGTILDGEYVYLSREKRHLFMAFDCIRNGNNDLRTVTSFMQRLENADKIIEDCFIFKGQSGFKFKPAPPQKDEFNIDEISNFYGQELSRFYSVLAKDIAMVKEYPLVRRKYFMPVFGAKNWEIFRYSVEFWSKYTEDSNVKFPYLLDGLIYHPLDQAYVTNINESKLLEYKWKPANKNSLDFYIEFKKDPQTGNILDVYDNSLSEGVIEGKEGADEISGTLRNKIYRICTLYVGKTVAGKEHPVPFEQNHGIADAYIYLRDGELRDQSGDIISDKTVVEFYYTYDPDVIPQQRWVPIKTRYEKSEAVERYGKKYGNHSVIAEKIWRSIINPVIMDDFVELAKGNTDKRNFYDIKLKEMNSKISHQQIVAVNKENKYYQKVTKIASTMRDYHNFIKSNLIYTYCNKMYQSNNQLSVLDIGCGRGGDIRKFYYTEVAYLVGVDVDAEGFKSPVNGAISRYNEARKRKPNFPKMYFIQADARALFDYDSQIKCLNGMDDLNKKLLQKFFPNVSDQNHTTLFDRIDCQFAMHYFLKDELSWGNFKQNLKNHLRDGGYFIATSFDARAVIRLIGDNDSYTVYYDDSDGNKTKFFEIVKRYDVKGDDIIRTGSGIDVFMSWAFDEGNYQTEYLVDLDFIKADLAKDVDLELIDTDLFSNQLVIHKNFLKEATKFESTEESRNYMSKVAHYYEKNEMNSKCLEYTNLHRYYVFRKKQSSDSDVANLSKQAKGSVSKGGKGKKNTNSSRSTILKQEFTNKYNFSDTKQFTIPEMGNYDNEYSMINSIHKLLVSHAILPKSTRVEDFMHDIGSDVIKDHNVTEEYIKSISDKTIINHEINNEDGTSKVHQVLDGLTIFFVERDCNNFYDITYNIKNNSKNSDRAIILMKEGSLYKPVMRKDNKGLKGIFKIKDEMIDHLIENGDTI